MTITKHGNKWYYYYFRCPCCGCEWTAGKKEVHQGTIAYDDRTEEVMFCGCPECGHDTDEVNLKNIFLQEGVKRW